jgi:hypothetical protein
MEQTGVFQHDVAVFFPVVPGRRSAKGEASLVMTRFPGPLARNMVLTREKGN